MRELLAAAFVIGLYSALFYIAACWAYGLPLNPNRWNDASSYRRRRWWDL